MKEEEERYESHGRVISRCRTGLISHSSIDFSRVRSERPRPAETKYVIVLGGRGGGIANCSLLTAKKKESIRKYWTRSTQASARSNVLREAHRPLSTRVSEVTRSLLVLLYCNSLCHMLIVLLYELRVSDHDTIVLGVSPSLTRPTFRAHTFWRVGDRRVHRLMRHVQEQRIIHERSSLVDNLPVSDNTTCGTSARGPGRDIESGVVMVHDNGFELGVQSWLQTTPTHIFIYILCMYTPENQFERRKNRSDFFADDRFTPQKRKRSREITRK